MNSATITFSRATLLVLLTMALTPAASRAADPASQLYIGAASTTITPDRPVALAGQMHTRIARKVETPVTASLVAIESREGDKVLDQAIMVSCDLVSIREGVLAKVRERVKTRLPDFDANKIFLSATHTHTAPATLPGEYIIPQDVMQPAEYLEFFATQVTDAAAKAWEGRKPGSVGWGLGHAVVAQNRRAVYADDHAEMYGQTNLPTFRRFEAHEDHGVEVLCFWGENKQLIATAINVACPAQEVERITSVNADFWHPVREMLRAKHGKDLVVLGWAGAAGDQWPHLMIRTGAEERMRRLRKLERMSEIARRIVAGWEEAYEGAAQEMHADATLIHTVKTIELPRRLVTEAEAADAKAQAEKTAKDPTVYKRMMWNQKVVDRYQEQQAGPLAPYEMELHVLRLGDVAIATNDFELFTEYGMQMKARSRALQTFVIQLAGPGSYVPTAAAVRGGGYSAIVQSSKVGPEGGQALVGKTVEAINSLWPRK